MFKMDVRTFWYCLYSCYAFLIVPNYYSNYVSNLIRTINFVLFNFLKAKLFYNQGRSVGLGQLLLLIIHIRFKFIIQIYNNFSVFLKAKLFYNQGRSVRPLQLALFVNLNSLKLYYRFQTLHDDSCSSQVQCRKRSNYIIVTKMSVRPFLTS